jgi:drug/metabolite transporter (DMT)-like permease
MASSHDIPVTINDHNHRRDGARRNRRRDIDLDDIRAESGLPGAIKAVVTSPFLIGGIACMAISFFSLLFALSGADLSLVAPATNSLTFIATAVAAKFFLKENVDHRRWLAAVFVAVGMALLTL